MVTTNENSSIKFDDILKISLQEKIEDIIPNFRKKSGMTIEQVEKIIESISVSLKIRPDRVLIGMMLLFLQGAASAGTPITMSVDIGDGKSIEKRNIINACNLVAGHQYIRRIAEAIATQIGEFASKNKLAGELAYRINNRLKAETGNSLSEIEMAYCSSFSQTIPNLAEITSERLAKLLAEDYQRRFENKKKIKYEEYKTPIKKSTKKKKKK